MSGDERFLAAMYGTVMRGMPHHHRIAGARYVGDARTQPRYRLFAVDGEYPLMVESLERGGAIDVQVFSLTSAIWRAKVDREPDGLYEAAVLLQDGRTVAVMLGDAAWAEARDGVQDITSYGGWAAYLASRSSGSRTDAAPTEAPE